MLTRKTSCLLAACAVVSLNVAGCTTTLTGVYWMPEVEGASGGKTLDVKADLGIDIPYALYYEVVGEEAGQRVRVNYWQVKGLGNMAVAPRDYTFDTLSVTAGDQTRASVDVTIAEVLYEPAFIRTPWFRVRGIIGIDLVQFYMMIRNETTAQMAGVSIPGSEGLFMNLGIKYEPVPLLGGSVEYALKPWLKVAARTQFFESSLLPTGNVTAAFVATQIDLIIGAPEGRGLAVVASWRDFSAQYNDGTTASKARSSGYSVSLFLAF